LAGAYLADRILEIYLTRLTKRKQPEAEDLGQSSSRLRKATLRTWQELPRSVFPRDRAHTQFGLHPAQRAVVFVEATLKPELYPKLAELFAFSLHNVGIEIRDIQGIGNAFVRPR
jgi:hypothetical protein